MTLGSGGLSKWFVVFCIVFGVGLGFVTAAMVMSFWTMMAGEEVHRGLFVLVWMVAAVIFFAWPMHIVTRARAVRRQRRVMRERIGDLDYEPPTFPIFGTRAPGPKDELEIKAPDIGDGRFRTFLSRGRTAEQRMADHLRTLELKAEMKRANESKSEGQKGSDPLE
ncbi:MAG TPA: hypothetical protein VJ927_02515 [Actinomycetota bacterium]|nr:hypothetical protein [Actinomycetota bacterium]